MTPPKGPKKQIAPLLLSDGCTGTYPLAVLACFFTGDALECLRNSRRNYGRGPSPARLRVRFSIPTSAGCATAPFRSCAHRRHLHLSQQDFHRPATERRLVGAVSAYGGDFDGVRLYRGAEDRFPQDHGKPDAGPAQTAGASGAAAGGSARRADAKGSQVHPDHLL